MPKRSRRRFSTSTTLASCTSGPAGWCAGGAGLEARDQGLGLPDVKAVFDDAVRREFLLFLAGEAEDDLGVADREERVADGFLDGRGQLQKRKELATTARLLPTRAATSSCLSWNCSTSCE